VRFQTLQSNRCPARSADVIQAVEQAMLAERIDLKVQHLAVWAGHGLGLQVDVELVARRRFDLGNSSSTSASLKMIGNRPFLKLLLKKMSA
jgi:hypothetical protein